MSDLTDLQDALSTAKEDAGDCDDFANIRAFAVAICDAIDAYATATFSE